MVDSTLEIKHEARAALRVAALAVVRLVCAHGATLATAASDAGLFATAQCALLSERWRDPALALCEAAIAETTEALRLWHACICVGVPLVRAEDAFACVLGVAHAAEEAARQLRAPSAQSAPPTATVTAPELYVPGAEARARMHEASQAAAGGIALPDGVGEGPLECEGAAGGTLREGAHTDSATPPANHQGCVALGRDAARGERAALLFAAMQQLCVLLVAAIQAALPGAAPGHAWARKLPADRAATPPPASLGFAQHLLPLATRFLAAWPGAGGAALAMQPLAWPAAAEWRASLAAAAAAAAEPPPPLERRARRELQRPLPRAPRHLAAAALLPAPLAARAARAACWRLAAELLTSRPGLAAGVVEDRAAALASLPQMDSRVSARRDGHVAEPLLAAALAAIDSEAALASASLSATVEAMTGGARDPVRSPPFFSLEGALEEVESAAQSLLSAAARLHTDRASQPRRLVTSATFAACRTQSAQLQAAAFVRLVTAFLQQYHGPQSSAAAARVVPPVPERAWRLTIRALLAVPCCVGASGAVLALHALQALFAAPLSARVFDAGRRLCSELPEAHAQLSAAVGESATGASDEDMAQVLSHAYGTAWAGADAAALTTSLQPCGSSTGTGGERVSLEQPTQWQPPGGAVGQRLPAPPDWFVLALASPQAARGAGSQQGAVRVAGAAFRWLLGLQGSGVLDRGAADASQRTSSTPASKERGTSMESAPSGLYFPADLALSPSHVRSHRACPIPLPAS